MTGDIVSDIVILSLCLVGLLVLVMQEWHNAKDRRRWRRK